MIDNNEKRNFSILFVGVFIGNLNVKESEQRRKTRRHVHRVFETREESESVQEQKCNIIVSSEILCHVINLIMRSTQ